MQSRLTFACIRCAERKVKCDRQRPCSACVRHKVDCVFQPPRPPQKRHRHVREQLLHLTDRLKYYETLLREQGIDPNKLPETPRSDPRQRSSETAKVVSKQLHQEAESFFSVESEASEIVMKTQLLHDQGRFMLVDNSLWSRVVEEFHNHEDVLENCSTDSADTEVSDDDFGFALSSQSNANIRSCHPLPEQIHQLWQIFVENVDPLIKVVHVPTLAPAIQKAASSLGAVPPSFEALMFSIYSVAVMSLNENECRQRLCESRKTLLSRYMTATKAGLSRVRFMGTTSLVVLQALLLYLLSVRDIHEPRAIWSLTGVAVRIAQGMGLERDGVFLGLSPFEAEMRRRIWWMLKVHDYKIAELCGLSKFRDVNMCPESTKCPTNVNDDQLYPGMPSALADSDTLTDMAFVSVRYELARFAAGRVTKFRQQGKNVSQWERDLASGNDEALKEIEGLLEKKYLCYCDPSQPLHLMTMLMARSAINTIRFLVHHPRRWPSIEEIPPSERQEIWDVSIRLLEQHDMLQSNPQLKQFSWHAAHIMQWHVFIHVLDTLHASPRITNAEKAWDLISKAYEKNPAMVLDTRKPIYVAVGGLCLKAYNARAIPLSQNDSIGSEPTPAFIWQLRQQREMAKVKRKARDGRSSPSSQPLTTSGIDPRPDARVHASTRLHQNVSSYPPPSAQTVDSALNYDQFSFNNGLGNSKLGSSNAEMVMDMDMDFTLVSNLGVDNNVSQPVTWEQWDTWLAESNAMPSFPSVRDLDLTFP
ncbi:hypothetical protein GQ43DRAFT_425355 [Delitschia confertaspora ATCC 74209]|uniref:Zn(2)-C6 fungal-type domain-containing protein n=1 Tax=Delitschia confertaspora ATCC 74209 TaxID=1513339 RepID=A0A9P4JDB7_9PLEO|nr:hypothetical protein GQ43DRAFT_425355 [Delitschia confertaspora ATCC 74209]